MTKNQKLRSAYVLSYTLISLIVIISFIGLMSYKIHPQLLILKIGIAFIGIVIFWKSYISLKLGKILFWIEDIYFKKNPKIFLIIWSVNFLIGLSMIVFVLFSIL